LANPADQALVVKFLESIDVHTVPFVEAAVRRVGNQLLIAFDSITGALYAIEGRDSLTSSWTSIGSSIPGNGRRLEVPVAIDQPKQFLRVVAGR
jgi:hypothetical protein